MGLSSRNKVSAQANMSSMTDLVFLLLVFFIILSTMVTPFGENVNLPGGDHINTDPKKQTSVTVTKEGKYMVNSTEVKKDEVEGELKRLLKKKTKPTVILRVDKDAKTSELVYVLHIANENEWKAVIATQVDKDN
jgi:biopolymer transport protein ExbD